VRSTADHHGSRARESLFSPRCGGAIVNLAGPRRFLLPPLARGARWRTHGSGFRPSRPGVAACIGAAEGFAQVAAAGHLAAAGLGVTLIPGNVVPQGLDATIRSLEPPLIRQLVAFTRQDWPPLAEAFLGALQAQSWRPRPGAATIIP